MFARGIRFRSVIKLKESANDWNQVPLTRNPESRSSNPESTMRKSESKSSLPRRRSLGLVTRYCPVHGVGTRFCLVRGVGTRHCLVRGVRTRYCLVRGVGRSDESLRMSVWVVIPRAILLFSTFAARFSDFVTLKKLTYGKFIRKIKVKPKDFSGCQLPTRGSRMNAWMCHPKSNRAEYQSCLGQSH